MPRVFIIILNWNNWPDVSDCLESIKNNDYPNYQVVIVDNGSKDQPPTPPVGWPTEIKVIYNRENLGFAGGNNVGIKYALDHGADYVLLLNDDTIVGRSFLSKLVAAAESAPEIGLAGPKIYFYPPAGEASEEKNKIWSAGGELNWLRNKGTLRGWGEDDGGQYDNPAVQEMPHLTGCCLLAKTKAIEKIGLLSEDYFLYYEDTDWCLKAGKAGYRRVFVPEAEIWHKVSKSAVAESLSYIYYHVRNGLLFARKFSPVYVKPFVHLDALGRTIKQIVKLIFIPSKRAWGRAILLGITDFYLGRKGKYENWH